MICALTRGICVCAISEEEGSRAPIIAPDRFQCDSPGLECEPDPRPAQVACRAAWVQQRRAQSSQRAESYRVPGTATPLAVSTDALISTTIWGQVQDCIHVPRYAERPLATCTQKESSSGQTSPTMDSAMAKATMDESKQAPPPHGEGQQRNSLSAALLCLC